MSYDSDVVSATSGRGEPDWDKIIKLCNRIRDSVGTVSMAQAMGSVMRRVKHSDSGIQLHALTLLESCVSNCGQDFQVELTKPTFHADVKSILTGPYTDLRVKQRLKELLASWANEYKNNSKMAPLIKYVEQLRREGVLNQSSPAPVRQQQPVPTAPAATGSREDADLKKAIELSLIDSKSTPPTSNLSMYPTITPSAPPTQKQPQKKAGKKVRAVYDFVAAEDNELSFRAGEIITVLDSTDENWWRGETQLGKGLFPASFVSANLSVEPQPATVEKETKSSKAQGKKAKKTQTKKVELNEQKIDLLLEMIKGADVTSEENKSEYETILELEEECKKMKTLADENIAVLQKQEDDMLEINKKFEDALTFYRKLLSEGPRLSSSVATQKQPAAMAPPSQPSEPSHYTAQSTLPPQAQLHTIAPPQAQLHTISPPQAQAHAFTPPQAQAHAFTPPQAQLHTISPPQAQAHAFTPPQAAQPHSITLPQAQPQSITPPQTQFQSTLPPPYTASQQLSYYSQQPDSLPAQMRSGLSPSPAPPAPLPTSYQANFYPQQQQTRLLQQPLL